MTSAMTSAMTPFPNIPSGQANLPAAFFAVAADNGGKILLAAKRNGEWQTMTYAEVADHVRRLAAALIKDRRAWFGRAPMTPA